VTRLLNATDLDAEGRARLAAGAPGVTIVDVDAAGLPSLDDPEAEILLAPELPPTRPSLPRLRWAQLTTAGTDHLALDDSWDGVAITTASGLYTVPIAEYVMGAVVQAAQQTRAREAWREGRSWEPRWHLGGRALRGATMLVLGYGSIGREAARLADAFGMRVLAIKADPTRRTDDGFREPGTGDPDGQIPERLRGTDALAGEAAQADYLVITVPLTPATRGMVDRAVLDALPPHAWVVNVGRGAVVDEAALIDALAGERIAGACLDVFAVEPLPADHPLWTLPNVVLTPHISGRLERWDVFADLVLDNLRRLGEGRALGPVVGRARGY
jgi:phosphoglycerate dehydrogenase-like enzyme